MDNLAHALISVATTAAVAPRSLKKSTGPMVLASVIVANIPDIDILLALFGQVFYHFHHRGFTHSFLGLALMVPLGVFVQQFLCRFKPVMNIKQSIFWTLSQLLFSHFVLDYMTSYGVMFLYPFSFARFSLPLMFIIDPIVWFLGVLGVIVLFKKRDLKCKLYRRLGFGVLLSLFCWYGVLGAAKVRAHSFSYPQVSSENIQSYPGPLAPLLWLVVKYENHEYDSKILSYSTENQPNIVEQSTPDHFYHDQLCPKTASTLKAQEEFLRYQRWATYVICEDMSNDSCRCHSMRYAFDLGEPFFGSVMIQGNGDIDFIEPRREGLVDSFIDRF